MVGADDNGPLRGADQYDVPNMVESCRHRPSMVRPWHRSIHSMGERSVSGKLGAATVGTLLRSLHRYVYPNALGALRSQRDHSHWLDLPQSEPGLQLDGLRGLGMGGLRARRDAPRDRLLDSAHALRR